MKIALRNKAGQYVKADITYGTSSMSFTDSIYEASLASELTFDWREWYPSEAFAYMKQVSGPSMFCDDFAYEHSGGVEIVKVKFEVAE